MAHRTILTERQRSALFDLPTDEAAMLRNLKRQLEVFNELSRPLRSPINYSCLVN